MRRKANIYIPQSQEILKSIEDTASEGSIEIQMEVDEDWASEINSRYQALSSAGSYTTMKAKLVHARHLLNLKNL